MQAFVACLLWLFAVVGTPAIHQAFHRPDHTHAANGTVITVHFGVVSHVHPDGTVHSLATGDAIRTFQPHARAITDGAPLLGEVPHIHDAAGLAHYAVALLQPALAPHAPIEIARASWELTNFVVDSRGWKTAVRPSARGPPICAAA